MFISVSVDGDKDQWEMMAEDKGGVQLLANKEWNSNIITDYVIRGIPRFMIIDKEGKIYTANAHRPSSKSYVMEQIDECLEI